MWLTNNVIIAHSINAKQNYVDTKNDFISEVNSLAFVYTVLTIHFIKQLHNFGEYIFWLNWLPLMIYKPNVLFERARIQKGFFIVQAFMHHIEPVYEVDVLARQRILFNQRIKIENTGSILEELNNMGINRASIFGDFDNIAKSIISNYK